MSRASWLPAIVGSWLPPILWMAAIVWFSTADFSAEHTRSVLEILVRWLLGHVDPTTFGLAHAIIRKSAHFAVYATLALLWLRALRRGTPLRPATAAVIALAVSVAWAGLDEAHQSTVPSRTASAGDVALDAAGAATALGVVRILTVRRPRAAEHGDGAA